MSMTSTPTWLNTLIQLALQSPLYFVYLVAICIALARWRRHPRASLLTILGVATLGFASLVLTIVGTNIPSYVMSNGGRFEDVATYSVFAQIVRTLFNTLGISLILAAIFVARPYSQKLARYDDPDYPVPDELTRPHATSENVYQKGRPQS